LEFLFSRPGWRIEHFPEESGTSPSVAGVIDVAHAKSAPRRA